MCCSELFLFTLVMRPACTGRQHQEIVLVAVENVPLYMAVGPAVWHGN